jgi:hypothetical protein
MLMRVQVKEVCGTLYNALIQSLLLKLDHGGVHQQLGSHGRGVQLCSPNWQLTPETIYFGILHHVANNRVAVRGLEATEQSHANAMWQSQGS